MILHAARSRERVEGNEWDYADDEIGRVLFDKDEGPLYPDVPVVDSHDADDEADLVDTNTDTIDAHEYVDVDRLPVGAPDHAGHQRCESIPIHTGGPVGADEYPAGYFERLSAAMVAEALEGDDGRIRAEPPNRLGGGDDPGYEFDGWDDAGRRSSRSDRPNAHDRCHIYYGWADSHRDERPSTRKAWTDITDRDERLRQRDLRDERSDHPLPPSRFLGITTVPTLKTLRKSTGDPYQLNQQVRVRDDWWNKLTDQQARRWHHSRRVLPTLAKLLLAPPRKPQKLEEALKKRDATDIAICNRDPYVSAFDVEMEMALKLSLGGEEHTQNGLPMAKATRGPSSLRPYEADERRLLLGLLTVGAVTTVAQSNGADLTIADMLAKSTTGMGGPDPLDPMRTWVMQKLIDGGRTQQQAGEVFGIKQQAVSKRLGNP